MIYILIISIIFSILSKLLMGGIKYNVKLINAEIDSYKTQGKLVPRNLSRELESYHDSFSFMKFIFIISSAIQVAYLINLFLQG